MVSIGSTAAGFGEAGWSGFSFLDGVDSMDGVDKSHEP